MKSRAGLTITLFFSFLFLWIFIREIRLIEKQEITSWVKDSSADCAVVLTGGANRVREGFDLLAQGFVHKVIISGVHPKASLRDIFPQLPFYSSINENDIILEKRSTTTYGNVQQTLPLVEALRCRDLVLITSRIHMRRALKTFQGTYPSHFAIYGRSVVSGHSETDWDEIVLETIKSLFYSLWAY